MIAGFSLGTTTAGVFVAGGVEICGAAGGGDAGGGSCVREPILTAQPVKTMALAMRANPKLVRLMCVFMMMGLKLPKLIFFQSSKFLKGVTETAGQMVELLALRAVAPRAAAQRALRARRVPTFVPPATRAEFSQRENCHHTDSPALPVTPIPECESAE